MARIIDDVIDPTTVNLFGGYRAVSWVAPELIRGEVDAPTQQSDVWSFGMTMYECLAGKAPFYDVPMDDEVGPKVLQGMRPKRPTDGKNVKWCTDEVWNVVRHCWLRDPRNRWTMERVSEELGRIDSPRREPSPEQMELDG